MWNSSINYMYLYGRLVFPRSTYFQIYHLRKNAIKTDINYRNGEQTKKVCAVIE